MGKIIAVCKSKNKGERKVNIGKANLVEGFGLEGDAHGGPWHRQVSLLAQESIDKMVKKRIRCRTWRFCRKHNYIRNRFG